MAPWPKCQLYHRVRAAFRGCATCSMPHCETVIGSKSHRKHVSDDTSTLNKCAWKVGCTVLKSKEHQSPKKSNGQYQMVWDLDLWNFQQWEGHRSLLSCSGSIQKHQSQCRESINFIDYEEFTWIYQLTVTVFVTIGYISGGQGTGASVFEQFSFHEFLNLGNSKKPSKTVKN